MLSQDPLPTLNRAFQAAVQEERVRGIARGKEEEEASPQPSTAVGFAVRAASYGKGRGSGGSSVPVCDKCYKHGHITSQCWSDKTCERCKKRGHVKSACYELNGFPEGYTPR